MLDGHLFNRLSWRNISNNGYKRYLDHIITMLSHISKFLGADPFSAGSLHRMHWNVFDRPEPSSTIHHHGEHQTELSWQMKASLPHVPVHLRVESSAQMQGATCLLCIYWQHRGISAVESDSGPSWTSLEPTHKIMTWNRERKYQKSLIYISWFVEILDPLNNQYEFSWKKAS